MKPALVIVAAGASSRLGTCKALVDIHGETILAHHLRAGASLNQCPPLIVTGKHHEEIQAAAPKGCEILFNPDWEQGRTGGIQLAHAKRPGKALMIAPVDVPLVPASVFEELERAWKQAKSPARGWLAPRYVGPKSNLRLPFGHPIVIGPALLEKLSRFEANEPLRALREHANPLLCIETERDEILLDLDTPEDLAAILARES